MQITINSVDVERTAKYSKAVVEYTNPEGKAEKKNVMSFANKDLYSTLSVAKPGEIYEVTLGKNDKGYWEFTSATRASAATAKPNQSASPSPKSTFETPEERAAKQLYIIRQSNINAAISFLSVGAKSIKISDVLEAAKTFENYVFGKEEVNITDMIDDMPEIE